MLVPCADKPHTTRDRIFNLCWRDVVLVDQLLLSAIADEQFPIQTVCFPVAMTGPIMVDHCVRWGPLNERMISSTGPYSWAIDGPLDQTMVIETHSDRTPVAGQAGFLDSMVASQAE